MPYLGSGGGEKTDMFSTDNFLDAEAAYRREQVRKDYAPRRRRELP